MFLSLPAFNITVLENKEHLIGNPFAMEYIHVLEAVMPNNVKYDPADVAPLLGASAAILNLLKSKLTTLKKTMPIDNGQECAILGIEMFITGFDCPAIERTCSNIYEQYFDCTHCEERESVTRDDAQIIRMFQTERIFSKQSGITESELDKIFCNWIRIHKSDLGENDSRICNKCKKVMVSTRKKPLFRVEKLKRLREIVFIQLRAGITEYELDAYLPEAVLIEKLKLVYDQSEWPKLIKLNKRQLITIRENNRPKTSARYFPKQLTFPARDGKTLTYKLVSKVEHSGNRNSGHYWTHAYRDGSFKNFNDSSVTMGNDTPTQQTFVVAYHLVK
jgi:ubiquitin C-terminal hydrolase